jgi:hypothetical protein
MSVLVMIRDWWHAPVIERLDRIDGRLTPPQIEISEPAVSSDVVMPPGEWRYTVPTARF